jgi:hypothetical protein
MIAFRFMTAFLAGGIALANVTLPEPPAPGYGVDVIS